MRTAPPPTSITSVMPGALRRLLFVNFSCMWLGEPLPSNPTPPREGLDWGTPQDPRQGCRPAPAISKCPLGYRELELGSQTPGRAAAPAPPYLNSTARLPASLNLDPRPLAGLPPAPRRSLLDRQATEGLELGTLQTYGGCYHPCIRLSLLYRQGTQRYRQCDKFSGSASAKTAILGCARWRRSRR
jgi:hypothetical protein